MITVLNQEALMGAQAHHYSLHGGTQAQYLQNMGSSKASDGYRYELGDLSSGIESL
jgi:hypothetical protein